MRGENTEIRIEHLRYWYEKKDVILDDINLALGGPRLYCLIGPNGVGKSTLVKCLSGLLHPCKGRVLIDGRDVTDYSIRELASLMSYIPVSQNYNFKMTVTDIVLLGRYDPRKWRTDRGDLGKVYKALRIMDLEDYALRDVSELSAGQFQQVNLCKGLVHDSRVMILDEPTANLDVRHQIFITELLKGLSRQSNLTVIMISHDLNIAADFADEVVLMAEPGVIYACGPPEQVITKESVSAVYGVDCDVITHRGKPHVILNHALPLERTERQQTDSDENSDRRDSRFSLHDARETTDHRQEIIPCS